MKVYLIAKFWKLLWNDIQFGTWFIILCWGNAATCDLKIVTWTLMLYWFAVDTFMLSYFYVLLYNWYFSLPSFYFVNLVPFPIHLFQIIWSGYSITVTVGKTKTTWVLRLNWTNLWSWITVRFEIKDTFSMSNYIKTPLGLWVCVNICNSLFKLIGHGILKAVSWHFLYIVLSTKQKKWA